MKGKLCGKSSNNTKISKVREIDSPKRDICELRFEDSLWHVVGAKNTYNVGQRVVFFAPGCVIPKGTAAYAHLCDFARKNAKGMEVTDDYIRVHASSVGIKHKTHGLVLPLPCSLSCRRCLFGQISQNESVLFQKRRSIQT